MKVVASDAHLAHATLELHNGVIGPSFDSPDRAELIASALRTAGHEIVEPAPIDRALLERVHDQQYLDVLASAWDRWVAQGEEGPAAMPFAWPQRGAGSHRPTDLVGQLGYHSFASDTAIVAGTWSAVQASAALAMTAADLALGDEAATYALCRPPGHHATVDQFGGYCFVNNAGVAAQRLLDNGLGRVAILDVDYHHGNGTQAIFFDRSDVLTVSIHADPAEEFPWFAGHADEVGSGAGDGWNRNLPLPRHSDLDAWFGALDAALEAVVGCRPEAVVVALGVDTYVDDPLGTFALDTPDFATAGDRIAGLAMPTVVVQEGGYATEAIGANVAAFLGSLSG